jgi:hypothetical protein
MKCKILIFIIAAIIFIPITLSSIHIAYGATNYDVNATVRISICGNGVIEGGEDCEGINLNAKTCQDFKSQGGALSCDISCSFNASQCSNAKQVEVQAQTYIKEQMPFLNSTIIPTITPVKTRNHTQQTTFFRSILPPKVNIFDIDKDGHITTSELPDILKMWTSFWKNNSKNKECDLTGNGTCEIKDLSVLLYYVNR